MLPPLTYAEALARLAAIAAAETDPRINPVCRSFALTHAGRAPRCTVLLHGYTNCPQQFRAFAGLLHARGQAVYVPRLPRHGLADRLAPDQAGLSAAELLAHLDESLAIAHGLGERVGVLGLSAGAVLAAHAAQRRADVAQAVIIAPVFGTPGIAAWAVRPLAWLARLLPNIYRWWDAERREALVGPTHAYPRYSSHALAAIVGLGLTVLREARTRPPAATDVLVVANQADQAVTSKPVELLVARWRARGASPRVHILGAELGLIHDLIDPAQERQRTDYVYPLLLELMG